MALDTTRPVKKWENRKWSPEFWKGAHVYGHNHESLGFALLALVTFQKTNEFS